MSNFSKNNDKEKVSYISEEEKMRYDLASSFAHRHGADYDLILKQRTFAKRLFYSTLGILILLILGTYVTAILLDKSNASVRSKILLFSLGMSVLTALWTYASIFFTEHEHRKKSSYEFPDPGSLAIIFGFIFVPFNLLIMDINIYLEVLIPLNILHAFGFYFLGKEVVRYIKNREICDSSELGDSTWHF